MKIPVIGDIITSVKDLVSEAVVDVDKKKEIELEFAKLEAAQLIAQTEVNKVEASHRSIFVAGWRPFIGWACGGAFIYNTIIAPMTGWGAADLGFLQTILLGMLGLGAMRSYDKAKGTSNDVLRPVSPKKDTAPVVPPGFGPLPEKAPW